MTVMLNKKENVNVNLMLQTCARNQRQKYKSLRASSYVQQWLFLDNFCKTN
jgi:hypothetical protein